MNVGPCISPPPSPAEIVSATAPCRASLPASCSRRSAPCRRTSRRARRRRARTRTARRCARSRSRSHRARAAARARRTASRSSATHCGRVEAHAPRSLNDRLEDHRGELVRVAHDELAHLLGPTLSSPASKPSGGRSAKTCCASTPANSAVHAADRVAHRHRAERVAVIAASDRQQPRARARARARAGTAGTS